MFPFCLHLPRYILMCLLNDCNCHKSDRISMQRRINTKGKCIDKDSVYDSSNSGNSTTNKEMDIYEH